MDTDITKPYCTVFCTLFLTRRLIYSVTLVMLQNSLLQLFITSTYSVAILTYIIKFRPFLTALNNFLEIFNELCFLILVYLSYLFTDYVVELQAKQQIGWLFIFLIAFNIGVNFILIGIEVLSITFRTIKKYLKKWRSKNKVMCSESQIK